MYELFWLLEYISKSNIGNTKLLDHSFNNRDESLSIFPNPVEYFLNINLETPDYQEIELSIHNALGKKLWLKKFKNNKIKTQINVKQWDNGLYFLKINTNKTILVKKFFVNS